MRSEVTEKEKKKYRGYERKLSRYEAKSEQRRGFRKVREAKGR